MDITSIITLVNLLSWGGAALVMAIFGWMVIERYKSRREERAPSGQASYSAVVDAFSDGVLLLGKDGSVRDCNPAAGAILERNPSDLIGARAIESRWKVEDESGRALAEEDHPVTQVLQAGKDQMRGILRLESPDGKSRWIRSSVRALPPSLASEGVAAVAKIRDITEERLALQALKEAEQTFRNLFERSPNGMSITRARDGLVIEANEAWCRLFGLTRDEAIGHTLYDLGIWLKPEDRQALLESMGRGQVIHAWPFRTARKDGSGLQVGLGLAALTLNGEDCLLAVLQDHTELRQMETDQRKVEKAESLGLMAAGVAHDFNNLFQSLLTSLELAHSCSDATSRHFLDRAMASLERASSVSRRLMEFSGGSFTQPEAIPINALVHGVVATLVKDGISSPRLSLAADLPPVLADKKQVCRVLEVLVENAMEAMGPGDGAVTLASMQMASLPPEVRKQGHWMAEAPEGPLVRVTVSDSAGGVHRNHIDQLFDPYFSTKAPGRGLGLPAALGLLRGNRAGLQVMNQQGEGLTVHVYLPVAPQA